MKTIEHRLVDIMGSTCQPSKSGHSIFNFTAFFPIKPIELSQLVTPCYHMFTLFCQTTMTRTLKCMIKNTTILYISHIRFKDLIISFIQTKAMSPNLDPKQLAIVLKVCLRNWETFLAWTWFHKLPKSIQTWLSQLESNIHNLLVVSINLNS